MSKPRHQREMRSKNVFVIKKSRRDAIQNLFVIEKSSSDAFKDVFLVEKSRRGVKTLLWSRNQQEISAKIVQIFQTKRRDAIRGVKCFRCFLVCCQSVSTDIIALSEWGLSDRCGCLLQNMADSSLTLCSSDPMRRQRMESLYWLLVHTDRLWCRLEEYLFPGKICSLCWLRSEMTDSGTAKKNFFQKYHQSLQTSVDFNLHWQVLVRTAKGCQSELGLLFFCLIMFAVLFATLVFYAEINDTDPYEAPFRSIPHTIWWAIVTLTSLGESELICACMRACVYARVACVGRGGRLLGSLRHLHTQRGGPLRLWLCIGQSEVYVHFRERVRVRACLCRLWRHIARDNFGRNLRMSCCLERRRSNDSSCFLLRAMQGVEIWFHRQR